MAPPDKGLAQAVNSALTASPTLAGMIPVVIKLAALGCMVWVVSVTYFVLAHFASDSMERRRVSEICARAAAEIQPRSGLLK